MSFLTSMFKTEKPVIGMLHLRPLPGDPLYYPGGSVSQVVEAAKRDLEALQQGGVDGILITNELSRFSLNPCIDGLCNRGSVP